MSTIMILSLTFSFLFFFLSSINAFNITEILNEHPDFSTFNDQLTRTQLATAINARRTITVLVVDNGALSGISGMSTEEVKKVLSVHVVLDYYDMQKLEKMSGKSRLLTTLFQASGQAIGQQGFLNATKTQNGVVLGSAVPGSSLNSNLMRSVMALPYNISVLQVSSVIVPPNLSNNSSTASPPSKSPTPATAPAPSNGTEHAPVPSESESPASEANAPSDAPYNDDSSPPKPDAPSSESDSPASEDNAPSDAPSDAVSPPKPDGAPTDNAPNSDGPTSDGPTTAKKSSSIAIADYNSIGVGIGAVMWALIMGA